MWFRNLYVLAVAYLLCTLSSTAQVLPTAVFSEDFNSIPTGWTASGEWEFGMPSYTLTTTYEGSGCMGTDMDNTYGSSINESMISPLISLPASDSIELSFYEWYYTESSLDDISMEISTDTGSSWQTLISDRSGSSTSWKRTNVSLTNYSNQNILCRFRIETDGSVSYAGWFIDKFEINAIIIDSINQPQFSVSDNSFNISGADTVYEDFTIYNTGGLADLSYTINASNITGSNASPNVIIWTYGTDLSGELVNTTNAITSNLPGATIQNTNSTSASVIQTYLNDADVFIIPDNEVTNPSSTLGSSLKPVLDNFLAMGGTVIALAPNNSEIFLESAGLANFTSITTSSSNSTLTVLDNSHHLFNGVATTSLNTVNLTSLWSSASSSAVPLATYSSSIAISEEIRGAGHIYILGSDFYLNNTQWNKVLANACSMSSGAPVFIASGNSSGVLSPDSSITVTLGFDLSNLADNIYTGSFSVSHNGIYQNSPYIVPCTLSIAPTTMSISATTISSTINSGDSITKEVVISNTGSSKLALNISGTGLTGSSVKSSGILINEISSDPDFIELINLTGSSKDLSGWRIEWIDDAGSTGGYTIPSGVVLPSGELIAFHEESGVNNDSVKYIGTTISWVETSEISLSLKNSSGIIVDYFRTSGSTASIPVGAVWSGAGFVRDDVVDAMYRVDFNDENSNSDWDQGSLSTIAAINPGQSGSVYINSGITISQNTMSIEAGETDTLFVTFKASETIESGLYFDTLNIIHNASNEISPFKILASMQVHSTIPSLIPYEPKLTRDRTPTLAWNSAQGVGSYTIQLSSDPSFSNILILQQTTDTIFTPLVNLQLGDIYWRVRSDVNSIYSSSDHFTILNDTIPILHEMSDTISGINTEFAWSPGAVTDLNYKITVKNVVTDEVIILSYTADTIYNSLTNISSGKYYWTVSAIDTSKEFISLPDTFVVDPAVALTTINSNFPKTFDLSYANAQGGIGIVRFAIPLMSGLNIGRNVSIDLYDIRGRKIKNIINKQLKAGYYSQSIDISSTASGFYICHMRVGKFRKTIKLSMKK